MHLEAMIMGLGRYFMQLYPKIAIIGKPNVGKSTLFNKICGRRLAITHDRPGVTRDAKTYLVSVGDFTFELIDTAGIDGKMDDAFGVLDYTSSYYASADLLLFVVDGRNGVTAQDLDLTDKVRKLGKNVILVINKCENDEKIDFSQFLRLGFKIFTSISAEHGMGMNSLWLKIQEYCKEYSALYPIEQDEEDAPTVPVSVTIAGRPNAGKSTLFNALLGFKRSIISEISGTTRDSITHVIHHDNHTIELIDTAGLRKKSNIIDIVEELSASETINAIRRSNVIVMLLDGTCPFEKQDFSILRVAINEGKGIVLVINKCDLLSNMGAYIEDINDYIANKLFELKDLPIIYISALKNQNINEIWSAVISLYKTSSKTINTGPLNRCLLHAQERHIPPLGSNGKRIRLKYMTQVGTRPPTFKIFGNMVNQLPESYQRYIYHCIKEKFEFKGIPIRILYSSTKNPYHKSS